MSHEVANLFELQNAIDCSVKFLSKLFDRSGQICN